MHARHLRFLSAPALLLLLLPACSSSSGGSADVDGDGSETDAASDTSAPDDAAIPDDTAPATDVPAPEDVPAPQDAPAPQDTPDPQDVPAPQDIGPSDGSDTTDILPDDADADAEPTDTQGDTAADALEDAAEDTHDAATDGEDEDADPPGPLRVELGGLPEGDLFAGRSEQVSCRIVEGASTANPATLEVIVEDGTATPLEGDIWEITPPDRLGETAVLCRATRGEEQAVNRWERFVYPTTLVGWWPLTNERTFDLSPNELHATWEPTDNPSTAPGRTSESGAVPVFNGTRWLTIPASDDHTLEEPPGFTLTAWVRSSTADQRRTLVSRRDSAFTYNIRWTITASNAPVFADRTSLEYSITTGNYSLAGPSVPQDDEWVFMSLRVGPTGSSLRVGAAETSGAPAAAPLAPTASLYIGGDGRAIDGFVGRMQDVRIFRAVLTPDELELLQERPPLPGLL